MKRFLNVVDDFYPNPDAVRRKAMELAYAEPEDITGLRTPPYFPTGVKKLIEDAFGFRITQWADRPNELSNGCFFLSLAKGRDAERVGVHFDSPVDWITMVLYMTPDAPVSAGTSLWQHKATGLTANPTSRDARRLRIPRERMESILERDSHNRSRWLEIDRVGNRYNRAVAYPAGLLHSASQHFGSNSRTGRIYQSFHFGVDWNATTSRILDAKVTRAASP